MLRHVDLFMSAVIAANSLLTGALSNQKPPLEQKEGVMEVYALAWKKKQKLADYNVRIYTRVAQAEWESFLVDCSFLHVERIDGERWQWLQINWRREIHG